MASHSLDELVASVKAAIVRAHGVMNEQHLGLIDRFFEKNDDGELEPRTVGVHLPSQSGSPSGREEVRVPLMSLLPIPTLKVSELSVEFDCVVEGFDRDAGQEDDGNRLQLLMGQPSRFKRTPNTARIKLSFTGGDLPEGVARLNDKILKILA